MDNDFDDDGFDEEIGEELNRNFEEDIPEDLEKPKRCISSYGVGAKTNKKSTKNFMKKKSTIGDIPEEVELNPNLEESISNKSRNKTNYSKHSQKPKNTYQSHSQLSLPKQKGHGPAKNVWGSVTSLPQKPDPFAREIRTLETTLENINSFVDKGPNCEVLGVIDLMRDNETIRDKIKLLNVGLNMLIDKKKQDSIVANRYKSKMKKKQRDPIEILEVLILNQQQSIDYYMQEDERSDRLVMVTRQTDNLMNIEEDIEKWTHLNHELKAELKYLQVDKGKIEKHLTNPAEGNRRFTEYEHQQKQILEFRRKNGKIRVSIEGIMEKIGENSEILAENEHIELDLKKQADDSHVLVSKNEKDYEKLSEKFEKSELNLKILQKNLDTELNYKRDEMAAIMTTKTNHEAGLTDADEVINTLRKKVIIQKSKLEAVRDKQKQEGLELIDYDPKSHIRQSITYKKLHTHVEREKFKQDFEIYGRTDRNAPEEVKDKERAWNSPAKDSKMRHSQQFSEYQSDFEIDKERDSSNENDDSRREKRSIHVDIENRDGSGNRLSRFVSPTNENSSFVSKKNDRSSLINGMASLISGKKQDKSIIVSGKNNDRSSIVNGSNNAVQLEDLELKDVVKKQLTNKPLKVDGFTEMDGDNKKKSELLNMDFDINEDKNNGYGFQLIGIA